MPFSASVSFSPVAEGTPRLHTWPAPFTASWIWTLFLPLVLEDQVRKANHIPFVLQIRISEYLNLDVRPHLQSFPVEREGRTPLHIYALLLGKCREWQRVFLISSFSDVQFFLIDFAAAAAAKSLQSCPTLCNPTDGSPQGSSIAGILQVRTRVGCHFLLQCMKLKIILNLKWYVLG